MGSASIVCCFVILGLVGYGLASTPSINCVKCFKSDPDRDELQLPKDVQVFEFLLEVPVADNIKQYTATFVVISSGEYVQAIDNLSKNVSSEDDTSYAKFEVLKKSDPDEVRGDVSFTLGCTVHFEDGTSVECEPQTFIIPETNTLTVSADVETDSIQQKVFVTVNQNSRLTSKSLNLFVNLTEKETKQVLHSKPVSFSTGNEQSKSIAFTDVPVGNYSLSIGYEKKNELSKWIALPDDQPVSMVVSPLIRIIQKQFNDLVKVFDERLKKVEKAVTPKNHTTSEPPQTSTDKCQPDPCPASTTCVKSDDGHECKCGENNVDKKTACKCEDVAKDKKECVVCEHLNPPANGKDVTYEKLDQNGKEVTYSDNLKDKKIPEKSVAVYECNDGFSLEGEDRRSCKEKGWDGKEPTCTSCPSALSLVNGDVEYVKDKNGINTKVKYSCKSGYKLNGTAERTCTDNGWDDKTEPQCKDIDDCERLHPPLNGKALTYEKLNDTNQLIITGSVAVYACKDGFRLVEGNDRRFCTKNVWNGTEPKCTDIDECKTNPSLCPEPSKCDNTNGSYTCTCATDKEYAAGTVCKCAEGTKDDGTDGKKKCVVCEHLNPPANGKEVTYEKPDDKKILVNSLAIYKCKDGYHLVGKDRYCTKNGWNGTVPTCVVEPTNLRPQTTEKPKTMKYLGWIVGGFVAVLILLVIGYAIIHYREKINKYLCSKKKSGSGLPRGIPMSIRRGVRKGGRYTKLPRTMHEALHQD